MQKDSDKSVKKEFMLITGILPLHFSNRPQEKVARKDVVFPLLAEKIFDNPSLLVLLKKKLMGWLAVSGTEFCYCLAGYIHYIAEEFDIAEKYFLKAVNKNPESLDNWFDLAFSLYHQGDRKHALSKNILFNWDYCAKVFRRGPIDLRILTDRLGPSGRTASRRRAPKDA